MYYYKGFRVKAYDAPYAPKIPGNTVYHFELPYEEICRQCGFPSEEDYRSGKVLPSSMPSIFDDDVKGIGHGDDLPVLDLSDWPVEEYMPFGLNYEDKMDDTQFWYVKYRKFIRSSHVIIENGKYGVMDEDGNTVICPMWDDIVCLHQDAGWSGISNYFVACRDGKWGFVRGVYVTDPEYDSIEYLGSFQPTNHPGYFVKYFLVRKDGQVGISETGALLIPCGGVPADADREEYVAILKNHLGIR